jgi:hypothetical protein
VASPASAEGAIYGEFSIAGQVLSCPNTTYTVLSGTVKATVQEVTTPSGNTMFAETDTLHHVVLVDNVGAGYTMRGATWFGGTTDDTPERW